MTCHAGYVADDADDGSVHPLYKPRFIIEAAVRDGDPVTARELSEHGHPTYPVRVALSAAILGAPLLQHVARRAPGIEFLLLRRENHLNEGRFVARAQREP